MITVNVRLLGDRENDGKLKAPCHIIQSQDEGFFTIYFRKFPGFDGTVGSCLVALSETSPNSSVPTITPLSPSSANLILVNCHVELIDSRRHLAFKQKNTKKKIQPLIPFKPTLEVWVVCPSQKKNTQNQQLQFGPFLAPSGASAWCASVAEGECTWAI